MNVSLFCANIADATLTVDLSVTVNLGRKNGREKESWHLGINIYFRDLLHSAIERS